MLHGDRRRTIFSCQSFVCCHVQTCHLHTSSKSAANSRYFDGQPGVLARHISAVMEISYVRVRRTGLHVKWAKGKMKTFNALVNIKIRSFFLIDARKKYFKKEMPLFWLYFHTIWQSIFKLHTSCVQNRLSVSRHLLGAGLRTLRVAGRWAKVRWPSISLRTK